MNATEAIQILSLKAMPIRRKRGYPMIEPKNQVE